MTPPSFERIYFDDQTVANAHYDKPIERVRSFYNDVNQRMCTAIIIRCKGELLGDN